MPTKTQDKEFSGRYYCRGAVGPNGHCDDRPMTIQCDYCIWKQPEIEKQNPYQHYYGWNSPID